MQADKLEKILEELEKVCKNMNHFLNKANALFEETLRANPDMEMRWKMETEPLPEKLACKLPERKGFIAVGNSEDGYFYTFYTWNYLEEENGKVNVSDQEDIQNIYEVMEMLVIRKGCTISEISWKSFYELKEQAEKYRKGVMEKQKIVELVEDKELKNSR